jgi:hypothetical protein
MVMTWIKIVPPGPDQPELLEALEEQTKLYPEEYSPAKRAERRVPADVAAESIVMTHSLLPKVLKHAFATFGALMDPTLPLGRRQHEMIAATVSALNHCYY